MAIEFLLSLFGGSIGGLVVFGLTWLKEARATKQQRELTFLHDQAKLLYGPLHLWTALTLKAFERHAQLQNVVDRQCTGEQFKAMSSEYREKATKKLIDLMNSYSAKPREYNQRSLEILTANWHLVDPEDIEVFSEFLLHQQRVELEPFEVWKEFDIPIRKALVGDFPAIPPAFVKRVNERWDAKRERLRHFAV